MMQFNQMTKMISGAEDWRYIYTAGDERFWSYRVGGGGSHDRFNQMTRMVAGAEDWRYIYTAGVERFWSYRVGGGGSLWALRDLDGRVE